MTKKITKIIPEFIPLRGLCEDVNDFLTSNNGHYPDVRIIVTEGDSVPTPSTVPMKRVIDVTKLIVRMNNYIAMLESASRDLLDTGSPERLLAVRAAREKLAPNTSKILSPSSTLIK